MYLDHYAIDAYEQTSFACPEMYEGSLLNGRRFRLRYRHGSASLTVWVDGEYHENTALRAAIEVGDSMRGVFDSKAERNQTFAELYRQVSVVSLFGSGW